MLKTHGIMKNSIEIAAIHNAEVAALKDTQLYISRNGIALRNAAKEAIEKPLVGTASEIGARFGKFFPTANFAAVADHKPEEVFVWAFFTDKRYNTRRRDITIACIGKANE